MESVVTGLNGALNDVPIDTLLAQTASMKQHALVGYYRVSTQRQGQSGLGLEAQRSAVQQFLNGSKAQLLAEFTEIESGKRTDRPELEKALALCKQQRATLVIAKLDRLARNAAFLLNLRDSGVDFVCADMPQADRFTVGVLALVAEREAELTSTRTKAALQAAKRRGVKLGNPHLRKVRPQAIAANHRRAQSFAAKLGPVLAELKAAHVHTLKGIARCLNARGFKTPLGRAWTRQAVARTLRRLS